MNYDELEPIDLEIARQIAAEGERTLVQEDVFFVAKVRKLLATAAQESDQGTASGPEDHKQILHALERARDRLQKQADKLHDEGDYSAEFPAEDAQRMQEAIHLLRTGGPFFKIPMGDVLKVDTERGFKEWLETVQMGSSFPLKDIWRAARRHLWRDIRQLP